jgi:hypothetical protein
VQIFLILVSKAKIRRKICRKIRWFPANFSFKGLKPKRFEHTGTNLQQKNTGTKTKKSQTYRDENDD